MSKKKLLFIAWDNPASNYIEGLFLPILSRLDTYECHVIQFSWADADRINWITDHCEQLGIPYHYFPVMTKPIALLGKYLTVFKGRRFVRRYVISNGIDVVIARSTMPAKMVLELKSYAPNVKIVFDADGLPIEERVDFAGLKVGSLRYKQLKRIEKEIVTSADVILTRTDKATHYLSVQYGLLPKKFFKVTNGRDADFFRKEINEDSAKIRADLGIPPNGKILVYCGSLGPQYCVEEMLHIHRTIVASRPDYYFMVLTNSPTYIQERLRSDDQNVIVRSVPFEEVPKYLSLANVALAIRQVFHSMQGVAPIKLGEYFLMQLPVVASKGIGDTTELLADKEFAFLLDDHEKGSLTAAADWILSLNPLSSGDIRQFGEANFSLRGSVDSYLRALETLAK